MVEKYDSQAYSKLVDKHVIAQEDISARQKEEHDALSARQKAEQDTLLALQLEERKPYGEAAFEEALHDIDRGKKEKYAAKYELEGLLLEPEVKKEIDALVDEIVEFATKSSREDLVEYLNRVERGGSKLYDTRMRIVKKYESLGSSIEDRNGGYAVRFSDAAGKEKYLQIFPFYGKKLQRKSVKKSSK